MESIEELRRRLRKLSLIWLFYPSLIFLSSILTSLSICNDVLLGLKYGLYLNIASIIGFIPLLGPIIYWLLVYQSLRTMVYFCSTIMWYLPEMFGLVASISYTIISLKIIHDYLKRRVEMRMRRNVE
ncbi:MAG: hypothetical protein B6V02_01115 [Thermoprotei archaeon ex4572_64]|nr:MAG: hypothetical protein B6V02_01115 [Thermoprotei archaeon ex4572_64]